MPEVPVVPPEALAARAACLDHAEDLLRAAEAVYGRDGLPHIAYHLGALALEEVGKAELLTMDHLAHAEGEEVFGRKQLEDHVRKLFWALWGPSFGREVINKTQIETFQGLARQIHETRLQGLYFGGDAADEALPKAAVEPEAVEHLLALTRARLELAKNYRVKTLNPEEQKDLRWYASATKDEEQRKLILRAITLIDGATITVIDGGSRRGSFRGSRACS